jgi:S1-C subfamily serine protease
MTKPFKILKDKLKQKQKASFRQHVTDTIITIGCVILMVLFFLHSTKAEAGGVCTGYIVSEDGYIATAGHCHGKKFTVYYTKNGGTYSKEAKPIARINPDENEADNYLLKIDDHNLSFFRLNLMAPELMQDVLTIGYPDPDQYGYTKKNFSGHVISVYLGEIVLHLFAAPGSSGSPVIDSNGYVISTLVAVYNPTNANFSMHTISIPSNVLHDLALKNGVLLTGVLKSGSIITTERKKELLKESIDKVVIIFIE